MLRADGRPVSEQIRRARTELSDELGRLQKTITLRDTEIERLKQEILSLQTMVQIESLKSELAALKLEAAKS